jgi:hypothetical protein
MRQGGFRYSGDFEMKKKTKKPVEPVKQPWLVTKTIKFSGDKLEKAKANGRISELAAMCRKQLDLLIK